jgi:Fe2+ or Zn2+ uptake regulation protein
MAVYESLRACKSHPTADELLRLVRPKTAKVSLATIYNSLEALCDAGLVRKMPTANGSCRYDADTSHHTHLVFRDTGEIMDLPDECSEQLLDHVPPKLLERIGRELGVKIDGVSVQLIASRDRSTD